MVLKVKCPVSDSGHSDHAVGSGELRRCVEVEQSRGDERLAAMLRAHLTALGVGDAAVSPSRSGMVMEGEGSELSFAERHGLPGNPERARGDDAPSFGG